MKKIPILDRFVVFEGIDGAGKSTQITLVMQILQSQHIDISNTQEPHNGIVGTFIRKILSQDVTLTLPENISKEVLAYLFAADRYEHIHAPNGILSLHQHSNHIILCDRYFFSSLAYQGETYIPHLVRTLNQDFPLPKLLIYFDIPPQLAMKRMQNKHKDQMETLATLEKVYNNYNTLLVEYQQAHPHLHILKIDATQSQVEITEKIVATIINVIIGTQQ